MAELAVLHPPAAACTAACEDPDCEPDDADEDSASDDDDAGSLVDFIVEDDGEEDVSEAASDAESEPPATREEALARELDGISESNIVLGKRARRQTQFYEQNVFRTAEYRRMMLCDVPADEMHALESSDGEGSEEGEEGEEDADASYASASESDDDDA